MVVVSVAVRVVSPIVVITSVVDAAVPLPVLRRPAAAIARRRRVGGRSYVASREEDHDGGYEEQPCGSHCESVLQWACTRTRR